MKIAIFGLGYVGNAVFNSFYEKTEIVTYDPKHDTQINLDILKTQFIFICVPTPQNEDGSINIDKVLNCLLFLDKHKYDGIILIKSTIIPSKLELLIKQFKTLTICYNPEFLTEKNYTNDFNNSNINLIGVKSKTNFNKIKKLYKNFSSVKETMKFFHVSIIEASLLKYTINSYLATKVIFMNEIYKLSKQYDKEFNWNYFSKILSYEGRIGTSHLNVPGNNNEFGFGGSCFPKDTNAFLIESKMKNSNLDLLETTIRKNIKIKNELQ